MRTAWQAWSLLNAGGPWVLHLQLPLPDVYSLAADLVEHGCANEYWTRRFKPIFGDNFRGLAPLQYNINAQAATNRALIP